MRASGDNIAGPERFVWTRLVRSSHGAGLPEHDTITPCELRCAACSDFPTRRSEPMRPEPRPRGWSRRFKIMMRHTWLMVIAGGPAVRRRRRDRLPYLDAADRAHHRRGPAQQRGHPRGAVDRRAVCARAVQHPAANQGRRRRTAGRRGGHRKRPGRSRRRPPRCRDAQERPGRRHPAQERRRVHRAERSGAAKAATDTAAAKGKTAAKAKAAAKAKPAAKAKTAAKGKAAKGKARRR